MNIKDLFRKYFDRKCDKPDMYILSTKITNNGLIYRLLIHDKNLKLYRIILKDYESTKLLYTMIISIILSEDISTIYYDSWNNIQLLEFILQISWIKLKIGIISEYDKIEDSISKDNIIDIQI